ncbi:tetratricopeptide repeat protein [Geojedonia litorea]|uniref:Tetratricopeptide repeat protein n=1 Tax=Geojedonia litorea TaxID=1268269 RepID=A0ABV9N3H2_9FLAO
MKNLILILLMVAFVSCKHQENKTNNLGTVNFKVYGNKVAQPHFEEGLLLLHSFEYEDAKEAFKKAQEIDPKMAMAYWGEAMTYNHSIWSEQDYEAGFTVVQKLENMKHLKDLSEIEMDFLEAVKVLYTPKTSKNDRDKAYMNFMKSLHEKYPDNNEVAAFYALSLLGSVAEGRNDSIYGLGAEVAKKVLKSNPEHPGALHYLIHSYDDPEHAKLAFDAANAYAKVAPDASHALHMPSHIYVALGMWDRVINSNIDSYQASLNRMDRKNLGNDARGYHAFHWLQYGYLQNNEFEKAKQMVLDIKNYVDETPSARGRVHMVFLKGTYLIETNDWNSPIADIEVDVTDLNITVQSQYRFLEGYKAFVAKDKETLNEVINSMDQKIKKEALLVDYMNDGYSVCSSTSRSIPTQSNINESSVMVAQLRALNSWLENNIEETEHWLKESITIESQLSYSYGPPVIQKPTHELYAEWLLNQNRLEEAAVQYDLTLKMATNRRQAIQGKKQAMSSI